MLRSGLAFIKPYISLSLFFLFLVYLHPYSVYINFSLLFIYKCISLSLSSLLNSKYYLCVLYVHLECSSLNILFTQHSLYLTSSLLSILFYFKLSPLVYYSVCSRNICWCARQSGYPVADLCVVFICTQNTLCCVNEQCTIFHTPRKRPLTAFQEIILPCNRSSSACHSRRIYPPLKQRSPLFPICFTHPRHTENIYLHRLRYFIILVRNPRI